MNRPQQIKKVFLELRSSAPEETSSRELLELSAFLVEAFDDTPPGSAFELRLGWTPFASWAVDRAFADGGWRVLALEQHDDFDPYEDRMDHINARQIFSTFETGAFA